MRVTLGVLLFLTMMVGAARSQETPPAAPQPPSAGAAQPAAAGGDVPNQQINDRFVSQWSQRIAGRESEPAERVFKNIQMEWLRTVPAERLLRIMNAGYSRALGVRCTYCHLEEDFASDDKQPKRAAREMAAMHRMINERLQKMETLEGEPGDRAINCFTCHRGRIDPMARDR